jgi:hypothetical protein
MKNNIILQHWNGDLPEWAKVAKKTVERYAEVIGCQYELVTGYPLGEKLGPNSQKLVYITEKYDQYEKVLMLDMDVMATDVYENAFERPEIGVLHDRAMRGKSRTPGSAPELFTLGMPIFFGNYIMTNKQQRIAMREFADWEWLATKVLDTYAGDEMVLAWLLKKANVLEGMSIEDMCMRCSGTSYLDIHIRKENRWDRKFTNLAYDFDDTCNSDKDASFLHFCQFRKNSIPEYAKKIFRSTL